ncbi:hypothetical protein D3C73_1347930 [compost metagenome]
MQAGNQRQQALAGFDADLCRQLRHRIRAHAQQQNVGVVDHRLVIRHHFTGQFGGEYLGAPGIAR